MTGRDTRAEAVAAKWCADYRLETWEIVIAKMIRSIRRECARAVSQVNPVHDDLVGVNNRVSFAKGVVYALEAIRALDRAPKKSARPERKSGLEK